MCYTKEGLSRNKKSNKLYTLLVKVFTKANTLIIKHPITFLSMCGVLGNLLGLLTWHYLLK